MTNLAALLEREASAEIETILSEARQRASEIIAKAEDDAKAMTAQRDRLSQTQGEAAKVRARSAAQLEASSLKLRAQHAAVGGVFEAAEAEIRSLLKDDGRYTPMLETLLSEAVEAIGGPDKVAKVIVNPADEGRIGEALKQHGLEGKLETSEAVEGGVKLKAQSNITVENGLFDRLGAARDDLASEVSKRLGVASGSSASQPSAPQTEA